MALLFEDDNRRLMCLCGSREVFKQNKFSYLYNIADKSILEEHLVEIGLYCAKCNKLIQIIKPEKNKILSI